ncbi:MAG: glycosyltransferase [Thermoleophilia bacterium]|nr:glycosyltransferase [Thermoleophilia bacterium]
MRSTPLTIAVVLTYGRSTRLPGVLAALRAQTIVPDHVLFVDNQSPDGTWQQVEQLAAADPDGRVLGLRLVRNGASAEGYHAALAALLAQGAWEWAWFVEDDLVPAPDALEQLLASAPAHAPTTVALVSAIRDPAGEHLLVPRGTLRARWTGTPCIPAPESAYATPAVPLEYFGYLGALVRLAAVARTGLPRRDMLGWFDDVEFSSRTAAAGGAWLIPSSVVLHDDGMPAADFGDGFLDRLRRLRTDPPLGALWKNAYGFRNMLVWGRANGAVGAVRAFAYWLLLSLRVLVGAPDHRLLRLRVYARMWRDGRAGRLRNAPPVAWSTLAEHRGSVADFLNAHAVRYELSPADLVEHRTGSWPGAAAAGQTHS